PLVAQILRALVDTRFHKARHREYARIALLHGEFAASGGSIVAEHERLGFAVLLGDADLHGRLVQAVFRKVRSLVLDQPVRGQGRKRRDQGTHRILVGRERLGLGDLPLVAVAAHQHGSLAAGLGQLDLFELIVGNREYLRRCVFRLGGLGIRRRFALHRPIREAAQHREHYSGRDESAEFHRLSPPPPDGHAGGDHDQRQEHDAGEENPLDALPQLLHVYRLVGRLFRADRNQVFVGTQPIHHVQEQVAIAVEAQEVVADPARAAHHYEPALAGVGSGGGQRQWTLFVLLGIDADLFALQVIRRVAVVAGREQLLYRGIAARFYVHRAGQ